MDHVEQLYIALGKLCYSIAESEAPVGLTERKKIHGSLIQELKNNTLNFDPGSLLASLMEEKSEDLEDRYDSSLKIFYEYRHHLTDEMKIDFIAVVEKIAYKYFSVANGQISIIDRFRHDLIAI